ncbi:MAG: hypothetical protein VCD34_00405, partial [Planctomycetota bacterium]
ELIDKLRHISVSCWRMGGGILTGHPQAGQNRDWYFIVLRKEKMHYYWAVSKKKGSHIQGV